MTQDVEERIKLNTAVSALQELTNEVYRLEPEVAEGEMRPVLQEALETLVLLLSPFAPHAAEEMWARLGRRSSVVDRTWPTADPELAREDEVEMPVQVNGKVRGRVMVRREATEDEVRAAALAEPRIREHLEGRHLAKVVVVPNRLISLVVK